MQEKPTEHRFQVKPSSEERERSRLSKGRNTSRPCEGLMLEHDSSNQFWIPGVDPNVNQFRIPGVDPNRSLQVEPSS
jgi:hypothetical protein